MTDNLPERVAATHDVEGRVIITIPSDDIVTKYYGDYTFYRPVKPCPMSSCNKGKVGGAKKKNCPRCHGKGEVIV